MGSQVNGRKIKAQIHVSQIGEHRQGIDTTTKSSNNDIMFSQNPSINTYTYNKAADDAILKCLFPL